ncbi:MAG: phosphoribosyltransferase family protein [Oscillospiraceae bacterium]|nr:phosphoribosyltransferase family protein [Oscillospiraceae bacterium]
MKITENFSGIPEEKLFALAERENNPKRRNLLVNLRQAKHFPALPSEALRLFRLLGKRVKEALPKGRNLVIAFAETATALGAAAAAEIAGIADNHSDNGNGDVYFIHTTRESFPDELLVADFSEEHSHAACQLLFSGNGKEIFVGIDNIIFIDDEFTTGKTIVNFVKAIEEFTRNCRFFAASLINGMDRGNLRRFEEFGVTPLWLIKTEDSGADMERNLTILPEKDIAKCSADVEIITEDYPLDPRLGCDIGEYMRLCEKIAEGVIKEIEDLPDNIAGNIAGNIAIAGTEECMLPSIILGKFLEEKGGNVRCRSTTRSPIVPSAAQGYPLNSRCCFDSPYEKGRRTFLYNSSPCDVGIIVTDAECSSENSRNAIKEIAGALQAKRVIVVILKRDYPKKAM